MLSVTKTRIYVTVCYKFVMCLRKRHNILKSKKKNNYNLIVNKIKSALNNMLQNRKKI